jgi:hypothetical protein
MQPVWVEHDNVKWNLIADNAAAAAGANGIRRP